MNGENANCRTFLGSMTTPEQAQITSENVNSSQSSTLRRKKPATLAVACLQCRARKVRCDAGQPKCGHCTKRFETCEYIERRIRGPDRKPGTRVRQFWRKPDALVDVRNSKVKKRVKGTNRPNEPTRTQAGDLPPEEGIRYISRISPESHDGASSSDLWHLTPSTFGSPLPSQALSSNAWTDFIKNSSSFQSQGSVQGTVPSVHTTYLELSSHNATVTLHPVDALDYIPRGPSVRFSKDTWWDSLLDFYGQDRFQSSQKVYQDINLLFNKTAYWTSFINLPLFFEKLYDPVQRSSLQPSLVLSALAFSTLMQSSETNLGESGRNRALLLRDAAQSSLEASLSAGWIETNLVQAALLLTIFEGSPHPYHSPDRTASALSLLDSFIYSLGLLLADVHEPTVSIFPADEVPTVPSASAFLNGVGTQLALQQPQHMDFLEFPSVSSSSHQIHTGEKVREEPGSTPIRRTRSWEFMLKQPNWPDMQIEGKAEIEKEEVRRLCWNALSIATILREHMSYFQRSPWNLHILKQENFAIFFPDESHHNSDKNPEDMYPKDTVWALHCRCMLLWNAYLKFKGYSDRNPRKADVSTQILREAVSIESAIARHTQLLGKSAFYLAGDLMFRIKALVSNCGSCCTLHPHMEDVSHPDTLYIFDSTSSMGNAGGSCSCVQTWRVRRNHIIAGIRSLVVNVLTSGSSAKVELELAKPPLSIWWILSRIQVGVESWRSNPSFVFALEQSWDYIALSDLIFAVWPSPTQRQYLSKLKEELIEACLAAGVSIPTSLPIPGLESHPNADITVTVPLLQSRILGLANSATSPVAVIPILPVD